MQVSAIFNIDILDTSGNWNSLFTHTVSYDTTSGALMPSITVYGIEVYTFLDTITLPGDGYYSISWSDCCRNGAIINMSNPLNENMQLVTYLTVDSLNPNSSPTYLTPPVAYLPDDTIWQYNPLPFDPDGDSLSWSVVTPLGASGAVNGYVFLSDTMYSDNTGIFTLDSITGAISWDPKLIGNFEASFIIEEFRNGNKIGEMRRDMQFIVIHDTTNFSPNISNMQTIPTNSGGYPYVKLNPGVYYELHLFGNDPDPNDVLTMTAYGEAFGLTSSPSLFSFTSTGNANEIEGTFSWTPDISHVRTQPYLTVFRTSDNILYYDNTIQFEVTLSSTGIDEINSISVNQLYPNPANNSFTLSLSLEKSQALHLDIYNVLGVRVSNQKLNLSAGNHLIVKNIDLPVGQYFVKISDQNGISIITKKLIVVR
tara:strand:- start:106 stop:1380 length:1275 start_codon:yes stop_codon:yes gene_type:complete